MRVYLNNLREVARGIRILKESVKDMPIYPITILVDMTGIVIGNIALIRDFLGKEPILYVAVPKYRWTCSEGGIADKIVAVYLKLVGEVVADLERKREKKCPICEETLEKIRDFISKSGGLLHYFHFFRPKEDQNTVPFSIACVLCEYFLSQLIMEWMRDIMDDEFFQCKEPYCIFSKRTKENISQDFCTSLRNIRQVDELDKLLSKSCIDGVDPPEYIDMGGIVEEIMKGGYLCDRHLKLLREKI